MKKFFSKLMLIAAAAMAFTSCSNKDIEGTVSPDGNTAFHIRAIAPETRSVFGNKDKDNRYPTLWTANKAVRFSCDESAPVDATPVPQDGGATAVFDISLPTQEQTGTIYAFSPKGDYNSTPKVGGFTSLSKSKEDIYLIVPSKQTPLASSVDEAAQAIAAKASYTDGNTNVNMAFEHIVAYGKMTITNFTNEIQSVRLQFPEPVAGASCKYYYKTGELLDANENVITLDATNMVDNVLWFALVPTAGNQGEMKVTVINANNEKYTKTLNLTAKALPFNKGKISAFSVNFTGITKDEDDVPVNDVLTAADFLATNTTYAAFEEVSKTSKAVYAGKTAKNNGAIQMRSSNSDCGIVTTESGGYIQSISVVWGASNTKDRTIDIYGKNTPYSSASDLYGTGDSKGTKIGSIVYGTSTELIVSGEYQYIGIRSNNGALYLDSITLEWSGSAPAAACEAPVADPESGAVPAGTEVSLSCDTEGATIYYTTDGSTPTTSSAVYSAPITVNDAMTISALAAADGYQNSTVASFNYTIAECQAPTCSHNSGSFAAGTQISLSCTTEGATIYYTTDGTTPTTASNVYSAPITINTATTIKAIAVKAGYINSEAAEWSFTISSSSVTWTRVTSVATLQAGGTFIIGYEATANSGIIVPMRTEGSATTSAAGYFYSGTTSGATGSGTVNMSTIANNGSAYEVTIVASTAVTGAVCIKIGDNYIGNTNTKNNCKLFSAIDKYTSFIPTIGANDVIKLTNGNADYNTLQYNASSPRFAVYNGGQKNLVIYKKN